MSMVKEPVGLASERSFLSTRRGALTLALLLAFQFLDTLDASIVFVALPSIQHELGFSQQSLQWVISGYLLTYGGFLLLGGRAADLLGRRRVLVAGATIFGVCSLLAGLATSPEILIAARLAQGVGAAIMTPAGLSILTTTFTGGDRVKALGAWAAMAGLSSAVGVFVGGLLSEGPGWRWIFFVNLPVLAIAIAAAFRLIPAERRNARLANFDALGAVLVTGGMLLLVHALINAPDIGWGDPRTIGELAGSGLVLAAFALNEQRHRNPLFPFAIFRIKGLAAADATQLIAFAGFYSQFFFITLYLQNVLGFSPIKAGAALLPVAVLFATAAGVSSKLFARTGTRPVIVAGALLGAAGIYYLSRIPVAGSYVSDLLPGLAIMSVGFGAVFVGSITAANAGVPADKAGLAAGLINTSAQLGAALGLAIFSAIATAQTNDLLRATNPDRLRALTAGYEDALLACAIFVLAAAAIALRTFNTRGEVPVPPASSEAGAPLSAHSTVRSATSQEKVT